TRWPLGSLVEIMVALGAEDGLAPIATLLESGLLLPELFVLGTNPDQGKSAGRGKLKSFTTWLGRSEPMPVLLAAPAVTARALGEEIGFDITSTTLPPGVAAHEADGLDWLLRMSVAWQQVFAQPARRTQQGEFFKRDYDRFKSDPLLAADVNDALTKIPDPGFFAVALASSLGLLRATDVELQAGEWSANAEKPLPAVMLDAW